MTRARIIPSVCCALPLALLLTWGTRAAAEAPALPAGLGGAPAAAPPALPAGLSGTAHDADRGDPDAGCVLPFDVSGFWETRLGGRLQQDYLEDQASILETRLQLELERSLNAGAWKLTADLVYDDLEDDRTPDLERGTGWIDLREANIVMRPAASADLKIGRQILTWGTGDLIFINDLFPKDWESFFVGRDDEYLKAPSDAIKVSLFADAINADLVYMPRFDSDRFIDGRRISFYNAAQGRVSGRDAPVSTTERDEWFADDEVALRLYGNLHGYEIAAYAYSGYWKSPAGMDPASSAATFPSLAVYGASVRGVVAKGIGHAECGYYDSSDDSDGADALIRNSEWRLLMGYEQEVARDLTLGAQYYLEAMVHHDAYREALPAGASRPDEDRHVVTLRLSRLLLNQNLTLSLFTFYSPSDEDAYFRPEANYRVNDSWTLEAGGNLFAGNERTTFFSQFEDNNNLYASGRYSF